MKDPFSFDLLYKETSETAEGPRVGERNVTSLLIIFNSVKQFRNHLHFKGEDISQVKRKSYMGQGELFKIDGFPANS